MTGRQVCTVLYGPTAVGKTSLIASLPQNTFEIISADSRQVYRYLDIGTAKPEQSVLDAIPHHLIDVCNPDEQFTAGRFVRAAESLFQEIRSRNRIPIVAGGTGYYIKNLMYGLPERAGAYPAIRAEIKREIASSGIDSMFRQLESVDPVTAGRISNRDVYRIERALEVYRGTGKPLSAFRVPDIPRTDITFIPVSLTRRRDELYERINIRVDRMFRDGLMREVVSTLDRGYTIADPGLRTIGYAEILAMTQSGCVSPGMVCETIKRNTRRYAKRQMTFFRSLPAVETIEMSEPCDFEAALFSCFDRLQL